MNKILEYLAIAATIFLCVFIVIVVGVVYFQFVIVPVLMAIG